MTPRTEPGTATSGPKSRAGKPEALTTSGRVLGLALPFHHFPHKVLMNALLPNSSHVSINRAADSVSVLFPHPFIHALTGAEEALADETQWRWASLLPCQVSPGALRFVLMF